MEDGEQNYYDRNKMEGVRKGTMQIGIPNVGTKESEGMGGKKSKLPSEF